MQHALDPGICDLSIQLEYLLKKMIKVLQIVERWSSDTGPTRHKTLNITEFEAVRHFGTTFYGFYTNSKLLVYNTFTEFASTSYGPF